MNLVFLPGVKNICVHVTIDGDQLVVGIYRLVINKVFVVGKFALSFG